MRPRRDDRPCRRDSFRAPWRWSRRTARSGEDRGENIQRHSRGSGAKSFPPARCAPEQNSAADRGDADGQQHAGMHPAERAQYKHDGAQAGRSDNEREQARFPAIEKRRKSAQQHRAQRPGSRDGEQRRQTGERPARGSLHESDARENDAEFCAVSGATYSLSILIAMVDSMSVRTQPRRHHFFEVFRSGGRVANRVESLAVHQERQFDRAGLLEAFVPDARSRR